ncbi:ABC transporter ATP-binding protein [Streptomyces sp. NRRL F-5193]|uniref:ABC transporter ATP-binding protein n=1 Tax=Streptomyces sp. NRRL F-5193 TaxID=1463860 RepID=UPI0018FEFBB0|nr:ABC transporter ATP-binding protein [Streptomyces sp. NRRL F-5193]
MTKNFAIGGEVIHAVDEVSLTIDAAEMVILTGASGSGKSTLLNLIGGLERPDTGQLDVLGIDVTGASDAELTRMRLTQIGFVFQDFSLLKDLTLAENVSLPLEGAGQHRKKARQQAAAHLERVGLAGMENRFPDEVSGGQQQRVAIARALVGQRSLILADEPTGALDSATGRGIMQLLAGLRDEGVTIVLSTHNPANVPFGDRVVELQDGKQVVPALEGGARP